MEKYYSYQVTVNFKLTDDEFDLLTEAMQNHNDCKDVTTQGEFWYGNMNRRHWKKQELNTEPIFYSATTRQLDTKVIKSLEPFVNCFLADKEKQAKGAKLYF